VDLAAVDEAERRLAAIVESSDDAIIGKTLDGVVTSWNAAAERLYGYAAAEIVGRPVSLLAPPERPDEIPAIIERIRRGERVDHYESVRVAKDGRRVAVSLTVSPIRGHDGAIVGASVIARDVTDRKRVEALFRGLLESAPDAIVGVADDGRIALVNVQAERLFGYSRGELEGQPVELLVPERVRGVHPRHRSGYFANPVTRPMGAGQELAGRRKDGSEFPAEISLSAIETEEGTLVSAAIRDVTDRKRAERALADKNVELERAAAAKDRFLASMSHELRTPLNAVIGFTGTLLMRLPGPLNHEQETQLRTVQASARHLLSIINDLLDLAKIESGKVELTPQPVRCQDLLAEVADVLQPMADAKGLAFTTTILAGDLEVRTDRRALSQILINLANNAIKFTDRGAVTLTVREPEDDAVCIDVADTGVGIPPRDQQRIFVAFEQVDAGHSRQREGTGLGLHICQRLVELLGGRLSFTSEQGVGSTFSVRIPRR
jgi:protein-histidine pros-kinase